MILNEPTYRLFLPGVENPTFEQARERFQSVSILPIPWVEPIDVSNALLFLASDESRYVTGLEMKIDGGVTLK
jgi:(+)-trans-carveol dehydrogenase